MAETGAPEAWRLERRESRGSLELSWDRSTEAAAYRQAVTSCQPVRGNLAILAELELVHLGAHLFHSDHGHRILRFMTIFN